MRKRIFSITGTFIALAFWFFGSIIHFFVYKEPQFEVIPNDNNELWMRVIIVLLIIFFGVFADYYSKKLIDAQKQLESLRIYRSMLFATNHILNNLLNQMLIVKIEAEECKDFNKEIIELYDDAIDEASGLIKNLSQIDKVSEEHIWASVNPDKVSNPPEYTIPTKKMPRETD